MVLVLLVYQFILIINDNYLTIYFVLTNKIYRFIIYIMNEKYTKRFLNILTSIIVAGLVIFIFPKAEIPSYITITFGVILSFLFLNVVLSNTINKSSVSLKDKFLKLITKSSGVVFIIIMLISLIFIFMNYKKNIYETAPPKEFIIFKWISYMLLITQMVLLIYYFYNLLKEGSGNLNNQGANVIQQLTNMINKNLVLILNFVTLLNFSVTGIMYIIISRFTTDG